MVRLPNGLILTRTEMRYISRAKRKAGDNRSAALLSLVVLNRPATRETVVIRDRVGGDLVPILLKMLEEGRPKEGQVLCAMRDFDGPEAPPPCRFLAGHKGRCSKYDGAP